MKKERSKVKLEIGTYIEYEDGKGIYEVTKCVENGDGFLLELKRVPNRREELNTLVQLKEALESVKMHEKDLFMLQNIVASLEAEITRV